MGPESVTAKDYESIKARAEEMGVSFKWALNRRRQCLEDGIKEHEADIAETVKGLAGSSDLKHRLIIDRIEEAEKNIRHIQFYLSRLKPNARKGNGVNDTEIDRAKEYPIESLLPNQVRHSMTLCPFHEDHCPSMSIKDNKAHCFSCNQTWDTISLIMGMKSLTFIEAVRYLNEVL